MTRHTHTVIDSPVDPLTLVARDGEIVGLFMAGGRHLPDPAWFGDRDDTAFGEAARQLDEYFGGGRTAFDLPLRPAGTDFQRRVWAALREIPYAVTISYGELARRIGQPSASRAVGLANGRNPIGIVVPCHRVIGANGSLTGYGGGLHRKSRLLALEQRAAGVSLL
ncbi:cysteine methyltransferase [Parafrankia colletiae]|uniref:Methylated-DNA--protein-cysteine methyltransferase n=1 Tax=Parafrankia colletiae TaxID=573497 RepID=A0A1S1RKA2_9ACTN|nr:methylated-DNA--[protein]-cysteine S-methyltransferase [Parafrankia colletiae]MCK9901740.1 methylated-DNA--[protein]-cysteine S-methyltransferase [Frankia sp. Cpl3]OHV45855.1 cysteine methyltransferase [Parafrankia colletiae]